MASAAEFVTMTLTKRDGSKMTKEMEVPVYGGLVNSDGPYGTEGWNKKLRVDSQNSLASTAHHFQTILHELVGFFRSIVVVAEPPIPGHLRPPIVAFEVAMVQVVKII